MSKHHPRRRSRLRCVKPGTTYLITKKTNDDLFLIRPMSARAEQAEAEMAQLERDVARALRIAGAVHLLQGELASVEKRIRSGERTNLLSELEKLAADASIRDGQLESIKERGASANPRYPELEQLRKKGLLSRICGSWAGPVACPERGRGRLRWL